MEAMSIIGFVFGLAGLSYATTARRDIAKLTQEFEDFKAVLNASKSLDKQSSTD